MSTSKLTIGVLVLNVIAGVLVIARMPGVILPGTFLHEVVFLFMSNVLFQMYMVALKPENIMTWATVGRNLLISLVMTVIGQLYYHGSGIPDLLNS